MPSILTQFKPKTHKTKNLNSMSYAEMKKEYTKNARIANKRIVQLEKYDIRSPALIKQHDKGVARFGIKIEGITNERELKTAYLNLMNFLNAKTSTRTGVREVLDTLAKNFNLNVSKDYKEMSNRYAKLFDMYDDLCEMERHGQIKLTNKYDVIRELNDLQEAGIIDTDTSVNDILNKLSSIKQKTAKRTNARYNKLHYDWPV